MTEEKLNESREDDLGSPEHEGAPAMVVQPMGSERWVQFAFIALGVVLIWFFDRLFGGLLDFFGNRFNFPEVETAYVTTGAAVLGLLTAFAAYKKQSYRTFTTEVVKELQLVTWPDRQETWRNTIVVIVTSVIAAVVLFVFDQAWSAVTDLIYSV